jgi:Flp pilus assembly protein TadB
MNRAYLLIAIPAALVGIAYVVLLRLIGVQIYGAPFLGAAVALLAAILIVRRFHRSKGARRSKS